MVSVAWSYEPTGVDVDWKELCPEIYEREAETCRQTFAMVVENAALEFSKQFVAYVGQVVEQLGNRTRLNPVEGPKWAKYADAELTELLEHEDDPDRIPEGHVLPKVRLRKGQGQKGRSDEVSFEEPIRRVVYLDELRPYETTERRKLYDSTVENLKAQMDRFLAVGNLLGPYQEIIGESVDRVKKLLSKGSAGLKPGEIAEELRGSNVFRNEMKSVLAGVATAVESAMGEAVAVRRKVDMSQAADLD
jgi:hypothetical protein